MKVRSLAILLTLLTAAQLAAQTPERTAEAARAGRWYLRIATSGGDTAQGRVTNLRADTITVFRTRVALSDVVSIDRRVRRGGGAIPAGLFGATVFGTLGLALSGLCQFDCDHAWVLPTAGGVAMGLAIGTVAGALVAPGRPEWRRIHPSTVTTMEPVSAESPYAGGGVTFSVGTGWVLEERRYRIRRLGLQLAGTSRGERPVETTGEFQLLAVPDGGVILLATGGANLMLPNGIYAGPAFGFGFGGQPMPTISARAGWRPRRSGMRPELRADYIFHDAQALLLTVSLGLEIH